MVPYRFSEPRFFICQGGFILLITNIKWLITKDNGVHLPKQPLPLKMNSHPKNVQNRCNLFTVLSKITGPPNADHNTLHLNCYQNGESPSNSDLHIMQYGWAMICKLRWLKHIMTSTAM